jgi:cell division protein FtsI (penicillin-binding protein 3)
VQEKSVPLIRLGFLGFLVCCFLTVLMYRLYDLHICKAAFLQKHSGSRSVRTVALQAHRGMITDRNGVPLAVSSPIDSLWFNPKDIDPLDPDWAQAAKLLGLDKTKLTAKLKAKTQRDFVYLKRHVQPKIVQKIKNLALNGVNVIQEYHRYYPSAQVSAQLVGTSNIDQQGLEGMELSLDKRLRGKGGAQHIIRDALGQSVEALDKVQPVEPGQNVALSIDLRLQYTAYRELEKAVKKHEAKAGSIVLLDVTTGEVLAMVNYPSFNPNAAKSSPDSKRNRALTDLLEPGSVLKSFSAASLLGSGQFQAQTSVDTSPGWLKIGRNIVRDVHNYGRIDLATSLKKSSNVAISKLTLSLPAEHLVNTLRDFGFGSTTNIGFPGESAGKLQVPPTGDPFRLATMAFGYGLSVTPIQLAQAYGILAADGIKRPVSLLKTEKSSAPTERVISKTVARTLNEMLSLATQKGGTGVAAQVQGYTVAGKTGTVRKVGAKGYEDRYLALFAGFAPAEQPRLAMVVVIDEPRRGEYYGGQVAAPVFGQLMTSSLRILNVPSGLPEGEGPYLLATNP